MQHIPIPPSLEEEITVLFCLVDDAYERFNPPGGGATEASALSSGGYGDLVLGI